MKGSNELKLNEATMIAAVQHYLNSQFSPGKAPLVKSVKAEKSGYSSETFAVSVQEPETTEENPA